MSTGAIPSLPEWHGWPAFRRELGSNLYALGVPDKIFQRILRHANVSTTLAYYVKPTYEAVNTGDGKARDEHFGSESELIGTVMGQ
jgi:integrase